MDCNRKSPSEDPRNRSVAPIEPLPRPGTIITEAVYKFPSGVDRWDLKLQAATGLDFSFILPLLDMYVLLLRYSNTCTANAELSDASTRSKTLTQSSRESAAIIMDQGLPGMLQRKTCEHQPLDLVRRKHGSLACLQGHVLRRRERQFYKALVRATVCLLNCTSANQ